MAKYDDIRHDIKTGDLVLFSGKGGISEGIKLFTVSKWSHVAMALRVPEWELVLVWESTTVSNLKDVVDGVAKRGVQLVVLSDRIRTYKGEVSIRHLRGIDVNSDGHARDALRALRSEVRNRPYEEDKLQLIRATLDGPFGIGENDADLSSLFCSELIAEAYQRMGLLPSEPPSNEYTPKDFSDKGSLKLLRGVTLTPEFPVTIA